MRGREDLHRLSSSVVVLFRGFYRWIERMNRPVRSRSPVLVPVVAIGVVLVGAFAWSRLELTASDIGWEELLISAALVPGSVLLTAFEYRLIASVSGPDVPLRDAVVVTVVGSIANLLPLPGAAGVRINDLTARSSSVGRATGTTAAAGVLWLGWALVLSGTALLVAGRVLIGVGMVLGGGLLVWGSGELSHRIARGSRRHWLSRGSAIELSSLIVDTIRIYLVFAALGVDVTILQSAALVASGAIASTVGIVPGGLGLRELTAALFAPLVGIAPTIAVLVVAISRALGLLVQAPVALATGLMSGPESSRA